MSKAVRNRIVETYAARYAGQKAAVLVDYRGLASSQAAALRSALRTDKIRVTVLKNSSARIAFERIGWKELSAFVEGPTAVVYGVDDPILLSKKLVAWRQKNKVLAIRGGWVDGKAVPPKFIEDLSKMPGREQILAGVVGGIASPLSAFVGTLQAVLRQFAATVQALADRKPEPGA